MVYLLDVRKVRTATAQRASGGRPFWVSLGMAVAFVCSGCVDLTKPWDRAGRLDAGGMGGMGGSGLAATGGGGETVATLPSGLDGGGIVIEGGADQAALGGAGDTSAPGAGGGREVGSGGAGGTPTSGTGEAWDAGSGGVGGTTPDVGLDVPTGGTGGVATDGAGGSPSDLPVDAPADAPKDAPTGAGGGGTGGRGTGGSGTGGNGTGGNGTGGNGTGGSGTGGSGTGGAGTGDAGVDLDGELSAGLIAYYPCESATGTVLPDSSGHGNNGTLASGAGAAGTGPAYSFAAGELGNALSLSSANKGYLSLPPGILAAAGEMTVAEWVYLKSNPSWQRIFDFGQDQNIDMVLVSNNNNTGQPRFAISLTGPSGAQVMDGPTALATGIWTHFAVVIGPSGGILYINGQPVGANSSMTLRPTDLGSTPNNYFGRSQYASDPYLDGNLDEIRVYDRALTPTQISALASGT